jgi:hypothetical protein
MLPKQKGTPIMYVNLIPMMSRLLVSDAATQDNVCGLAPRTSSATHTTGALNKTVHSTQFVEAAVC